MKDIKKGEWKWVSVVAPKSNGDGGHILLIFDSNPNPVNVLVTKVRLEGFRFTNAAMSSGMEVVKQLGEDPDFVQKTK